MQRITSFEVDHTKIDKGMYISRVDGDITTYDIRMVKPNTPPFLENDGIHSFEHLFATYVRNSNKKDCVVYAGPMGCRTGFYFLVRNLSYEEAIKLTLDALRFIKDFNGILPGGTKKECGNFLDHNIEKARVYASDIFNVLEHWKVENLNYPQ